jgi:hypothetical protein
MALATYLGFVANFAQEVMQGQWPVPVAGLRRPGRRTLRPQYGSHHAFVAIMRRRSP